MTEASDQQRTVNGRSLVSLGFDPGVAIYDFITVSFTVDDVTQALFASTYHHPRSLRLRRECADLASPVRSDIWITLESARALYVSSEPDEPGCYEEPDWYLQGTARFISLDSGPSTAPVHVYLMVADQRGIHAALVQVITQPVLPDPLAPLTDDTSEAS